MYSPDGMNWIFSFLSFANRLGCSLNNFFYNRRLRRIFKPAIPVISVGNISFGGSEKTPLAIEILSYCLNKGFKPALITRGYKGKWEKKGGVLSKGKNILGTWKEAGDEPFMVAQNVPQAGIYIGRDRRASCRKAEQDGFDMAVLDDGFQHRRLSRNLDIVLHNPGEKRSLRESPSTLKRADIILTKMNKESQSTHTLLERFSQPKIYCYSVINKGFFRLSDNRSVSAEYFNGRNFIAVCGIANPERFLCLLENTGLRPRLFLPFRDHHPYPFSSLKKIMDNVHTTKAQAVLTTEKDSFKLFDLERHMNIPVFYNKIGLQVETGFYQVLFTSLQH